MNRVLGKIITKKREDLTEKKRKLSLEKLKKYKEKKQMLGASFYRAIAEVISDPAVIAEVKFVSPSKEIASSVAPGDLLAMTIKWVREYESAGADAISIITEPHFFKGDLSFVAKVKSAVALPVLQKDFVIDEYQIYESKQVGADALLLIARLIDKKTLKRFVEFCFAEGIEPVVEIFSEEDLEKAVATKTRFIAVNARDLDTFEVDVERACELMRKIPERFIRLGFSGIQSREEVRKYREAGARGVLVGTALMRAMSPGEFLKGIRSQVEEVQSAKIPPIRRAGKYQSKAKSLKCS